MLNGAVKDPNTKALALKLQKQRVKGQTSLAIEDMLVAAKKGLTTKLTAESLELLLLNKWLKEKRKPTTDINWALAGDSGEILEKYTRYFKKKWSNEAAR
ncbi:hypothetical protein F442_14720 [Phytophthora nicotianae P10297]|uniref:RxLR effector protein n=1 Tax=Phytophthora nicotianae P10297 TaxID=1317064 RepID=W2YU60_PHYNI|nr:hypothetical protein F442_14720 [Phytophthora nicotianae P10297]